MEQLLALEMVRVTEAAALASARFMGRGDRDEADHAATEAMRQTMDETDIAGTIVIGEGERDEAPMLYIGEQVGRHDERRRAAAVDIAVDPLEGTNLVATGQGDAITVLAASEQGGLTHAPDTYLEKLCVGPGRRGLRRHHAAARPRTATGSPRRCAGSVQDITVIILDRPRHDELIAEVRATGARIKLITDGDLSAAISCAVQGTGVHAVMGIGGAPEGVITAAALRCLGGEIQARFRFRNDEERERAAPDARPRRRGPGSTGPRTSRRASSSCSRRPASPTGSCCRASGSSAAARGPTRWSWPTRPSRSGSWTRSTCSTANGRPPSGCRRWRTGRRASSPSVAVGSATRSKIRGWTSSCWA